MLSSGERIIYGDLSRLSHLYWLRRYVKLSNMESQEYIADVNSRSFPVYTIGDSYSDCRDYPTRMANYLSQQLKINVYNMTGQTVTALMDFLVSGMLTDPKKPKVVVWEVVERTAICDFMNAKNFDLMHKEALQRKEKVSSRRVFAAGEQVTPHFTEYKIVPNKPSWYDLPNRLTAWEATASPVSSINLKFIINNLAYYSTDELNGGSSLVRVASLKNSEPILYYVNEKDGFVSGCKYLEQTADFVTRVNEILKQNGIKLIFYVVPDKYDVYYNLLNEKYRQNEDHDFMGNLTEELKKRGVYTFNLLPEFREKIRQGRKDIYLFDDSHWDYGAKKIAVDNIEEIINEFNALK